MLSLFLSLSTHIKSKTSSCVVHFVDCIYFFLFAICYKSSNNTVGPTVAQVHKVFEWWLFCKMMKAIHNARTQSNVGCEEQREVFQTPNNTNVYTPMVEHQPMCLHTWIFIFVTHTLTHSKQLGWKWNAIFFLFFFHSLFRVASISSDTCFLRLFAR